MGRAARRGAVGVVLLSGIVAVPGPVGAVVEPPPAFHPYATYDAGPDTRGVAIGDVTGDGRPDVLATSSFQDEALYVFAQAADGTLAPGIRYETSAAYSDRMGIAVADLDGDGDLDAGVATSTGVDIFAQEGGALTLTWTVPVPVAQHLEAADVSGDGLADLVVMTRNNGVRVWVQIAADFMPSPAGEVLTTSSTYLDEVEVADVTGDGRNDVVLSRSGSFDVHAGLLGGGFAPPVAYASGGTAPWTSIGGVATGDLDDDGRTDVAVTVGGNKPNSWVVVRHQQPDGTLGGPVVLPSYDIPEPVEIVDVTGDGRDDIVVVHGGWNRTGTYVQQQDGSLSSEELVAVPYASHYEVKGLAVGDISGDGLADIAIGDYNHGLVVLRGAGPGSDTTPPETTITEGPSGTIHTRTATFSFTSSEPGSTFRCSLDGGPFGPCTSPSTWSSLAQGAHTFRVQATDAAGNQDPSPASRSVVVDGPATTITSGPTGTIRSTTATFEFTSQPAATSFECSMDGGAFTACASPATSTGLTTGASHTFRVRALGAEGLVESSPATRTFSVEAAADLGVTATDTPDPIRKGQVLTYTIRVSNAGPAAAADVAVTHGLPSGTSFRTASTTVGTCTASGAPATVRCQIGSLAPGGVATVTVTATVTASKGSLASTAVVSTSSWDPYPSNDAASTSTTIGRR
jgi:uncharacterized repeat protein (TIGR01451 family)